MNKNIRRSIVIAAGVTGAWALGSAAANADELPASSLSVPDAGAATGTGSATGAGSVTGALGDTVDGAVSDVHDTVTGLTGTAASAVSGTTAEATQQARGATTAPAAADRARRYVDAKVPAAARIRGLPVPYQPCV
ncbi:hypothetical protein ACWEN3_40715 [Streptomyces sp. NPDC004561]